MEPITGASKVNSWALVPATDPKVTTADTFEPDEPEDGTNRHRTEVCVGGYIEHAILSPASCTESARLPSAKLLPPTVIEARPRVGPFSGERLDTEGASKEKWPGSVPVSACTVTSAWNSADAGSL
jgi:hypothetical protein